ncbi:hypothetical protein TNCT_641201 [Trichonephila clavata]|uniref:Uncharacterized protein n=1 Tax=Trichonephila clavata TaxID=2740835 RepID=A0A8X6L0E4_TRICU|nr:hypothetical protein TNCT_641201 [Trichonephila clavata]
MQPMGMPDLRYNYSYKFFQRFQKGSNYLSSIRDASKVLSPACNSRCIFSTTDPESSLSHTFSREVMWQNILAFPSVVVLYRNGASDVRKD